MLFQVDLIIPAVSAIFFSVYRGFTCNAVSAAAWHTAAYISIQPYMVHTPMSKLCANQNERQK